MTEKDKQIITELLTKYGEKELSYYIRLESAKKDALEDLFLEYIYKTNTHPETNKHVNPCVSYPFDGDECFSNGVSSLFVMHESIIKPHWLKGTRKIANKEIIYDIYKNEQNKQKVINLITNNNFEINIEELYQLVLTDKLFSITELRLIQELLKNPQIYMSKTEPAVLVESEKGSAYILGKNKNGQKTF